MSASVNFLKGELRAVFNFLLGAALTLGVLLLPEDAFGRALQVVLGALSVLMLFLKVWKFLKRGFRELSLEDVYVFLSALVILTLIAWEPAYFFGLSVKIAFGVAGIVIMVLALSDAVRHAREFKSQRSSLRR